MERDYLVNLKENFLGKHEVHHFGCRQCSTLSNLHILGKHDSLDEAVAKANELGYTEIDGCNLCLPELHSRLQLHPQH